MHIFIRLADNIRFIFSNLRPQDVIDIFLVWVVVYRALLLIKRTSAAQILSGLGIIAIAYIISIWAGLSTLNWLLEKFFSQIFIILVILFQSEIRRALAHIGRNPFFSGVSAIEETQVVEEIAKGAIQVAQRGYGALIVIEREIGLEDFIEVGTKVDSVVSAELIQSIFIPTSPLHDGALIIRGGRAYAAGCFLPLTKNPNIDKILGTRHRAAIGLTEETDAVVIIVSEENKQTSLCINGNLSGDLDHAAIRRQLYSLFHLQDDYGEAEKTVKEKA
ncbi:MAG: diadenylate cyclase CdaA [Bdellovibrionia bacterium]